MAKDAAKLTHAQWQKERTPSAHLANFIDPNYDTCDSTPANPYPWHLGLHFRIWLEAGFVTRILVCKSV
jgi:hypothetical protein